MSREGEVWESRKWGEILLVLGEDAGNAYVEESICYVVPIYSPWAVRLTARMLGQWLPREDNDMWKRLA